jgi:hypothetical protein
MQCAGERLSTSDFSYFPLASATMNQIVKPCNQDFAPIIPVSREAVQF